MPNKGYLVNFICPNPNCNCSVIEEIVVHVSQYSPIMGLSILQDGSVGAEYSSDCSYNGGSVLDYRCPECEYTLRTESLDILISTPEELFDWLKEHNMLVERHDEKNS